MDKFDLMLFILLVGWIIPAAVACAVAVVKNR
jgi:hypothetical protein